jgi:TRAP-type mannitol/chloroaromatic compound transport system permease small subunit
MKGEHLPSVSKRIGIGPYVTPVIGGTVSHAVIGRIFFSYTNVIGRIFFSYTNRWFFSLALGEHVSCELHYGCDVRP